MTKIKWFQRQDEPIDVVERSTFSRRAGAYGEPDPSPPQGDHPAAAERARQAAKGHNQGSGRNG